MLFAAVTDQLDAQGVIVKTGTLIDATVIASASIRTDDEARWAGHRRKKPVHGYKAHVATDEAVRRDHDRQRSRRDNTGGGATALARLEACNAEVRAVRCNGR